MFSYNTSYPFTNFPFTFNYDPSYQQIYPQFFPLFQNQFMPTSESFYHPNSKANTDTQDEVKRFDAHNENSLKVLKKTKRITKKLVCIPTDEVKIDPTKNYKIENEYFKYFDFAQAPPITSLRNRIELTADLMSSIPVPQKKKLKNKLSGDEIKLEAMKLQILLKNPDPKEFPFLICKKRKYYRNMKRRYSVAYFEQRNYYIENNIPIPPELEPKNKNKRNNYFENSSSSDDSNNEEFLEKMIEEHNEPHNPEHIDRFEKKDIVKQEVKEEPHSEE